MGFGPLLQRGLLNHESQVLGSGVPSNPCKTRVAPALPQPGYVDGVPSDKQLEQLKQLICLGKERKKIIVKKENGLVKNLANKTDYK